MFMANKVAGEPPYKLATKNGLTLTVTCAHPDALTGRDIDEGQGSFGVPPSHQVFPITDVLDLLTGDDCIDAVVCIGSLLILMSGL